MGWEVGGDVIIDVHLADGDRAEEKGGQKDQIEGLPFIHNEARQLEHGAFRFLFTFHKRPPFSVDQDKVRQIGEQGLL